MTLVHAEWMCPWCNREASEDVPPAVAGMIAERMPTRCRACAYTFARQQMRLKDSPVQLELFDILGLPSGRPNRAVAYTPPGQSRS